MSFNYITELVPGLFRAQTKLQTLSVSGIHVHSHARYIGDNRLTNIPSGLLNGLGSLVYMFGCQHMSVLNVTSNMNFNRLAGVSPYSFYNLTRLQILFVF